MNYNLNIISVNHIFSIDRRGSEMGKNSFYWIFTIILYIALLLPIGQAQDKQEEEFPKLPQRGEKIDDFVPLFWNIEFLRQADLNKDGQLDTVMVVKNRDDKNFVKPDDCNTCSPIDINPRMLVVLFAEGKSWRLVKQNTTFIPQVTAEMDSMDPFNGVVYGEVYAGNGTFAVRFGWFGGSLGYDIYTFRWQDDDFYLIGYDSSSTSRTTNEERNDSYNFLTWRENIVTDTPVEDENSNKSTSKSVWKNLKKQPLLKLDQIVDGSIYDYLKKSADDE